MSIIQAVEADLRKIWAELEAEGHAAAARVKSVIDRLKGDVPALEAEVKTDAADVAKTAETQGLVPAEHEAAADAGHVGGEIAHDVQTAVADSVHPPAQTAAASTETHA